MTSRYPRRGEPDPAYYILEVDLARRMGCNRDQLYELRRQGQIPYLRISGRIVYRVKDIPVIEQRFMC
jgi:hypothetical protein